jgi:hypothetical protein
VPSIAVGPVNVLLRDEPFYEPLPQVDESGRVVRAGEGDRPAVEVKQAGEVNEQGIRVLSMEEMNEITTQTLAMCDAAETVVDAELPPAQRMARFRKELESEEVTNADVLKIVAIAETGGPQAYAKIKADAGALMKNPEWECEPLREMLQGMGGEAKAADGGGEAKAAGGGEAKADAGSADDEDD